MDVFIPEEYVVRRRMERKAAAGTGNRSEMVQESGRRMEKEKKARSPTFRVEKKSFWVKVKTLSSTAFQHKRVGQGSWII
ncbi:hypothetical protein PVL29_001833 [Vitis rotundifolia]|uniref:Uncharacterized protein n=1 Tax=Vitis rotundifolia TaxID=103349 RepID=A0AA39E337_VITRO|nr:hypothetical protein PVL29_001833 [Vitis rotundifolia]